MVGNVVFVEDLISKVERFCLIIIILLRSQSDFEILLEVCSQFQVKSVFFPARSADKSLMLFGLTLTIVQ